MSLSNKEEYEKHSSPIYDWSKNKIFIEKYEKMYLESIIKLVKPKVFNSSKVIFCMDSPKETVWRTKIQSDYKEGRCDLTIKNNFKPTFSYTYEKIIPELIKNENIKSIRIDGMEADDIIASICMYYKKNNPQQIIYLVSGDDDFLQLGRDNLFFVNYKKKSSFNISPDEAKQALLKKILIGDPSDCITGALKGKRLKKEIKEELFLNDNKLQEYLKSNPDVMGKYKHNQLMINFENIPTKLQDKVMKIFLK
jgi:5'-3' exonuclease